MEWIWVIGLVIVLFLLPRLFMDKKTRKNLSKLGWVLLVVLGLFVAYVLTRR